jgi:hypothetical protein
MTSFSQVSLRDEKFTRFPWLGVHYECHDRYGLGLSGHGPLWSLWDIMKAIDIAHFLRRHTSMHIFEQTSTSRRRSEPAWVSHAASGLPFMVQRNDLAMVALK